MPVIERVTESVITPVEKAPEPELGSELIPKERYTSKEFMQLEWERMWTKTWQMGCREEEMPEIGDYVVQDIGPESLLFVRGEDNKIRCFYNVCKHRGNQLKFDECGSTRTLQCAYHYWEWNLDGTLKHVPDPEDFPQGLPDDFLGLSQIKCDTHWGFAWFNLDPDAEPLKDYLAEMCQHLDPYHFENMVMVNNQTIEWDCNWKASVDAFNETYHVQAIHPELMYYLDDVKVQIDLYEKHNRYLVPFMTFSSRIDEPEEMPEILQFMMQEEGLDPASYDGKPSELRKFLQKWKRDNQEKLGYDYAEMNDDQLTDDYHYMIFPNMTMNIHVEHMMLFRQRPHPTDPNRMYWDLMNFALPPKGKPKPPVAEHEQFKHGEKSIGLVLDQDSVNLPHVQQGMNSAGYEGLWISYQERRIRHFHKTLDNYVYGKGANDS